VHKILYRDSIMALKVIYTYRKSLCDVIVILINIIFIILIFFLTLNKN